MSGARRRAAASACAEPGQPIRTCVGCRQRAPRSVLLRLVADGEQVVVDERRRLPGRGAWLHPDQECLRRARRRDAFSRALRTRGLSTTPVVAYLTEPDDAGRSGGGAGDARTGEDGKQVDPS